MSEPVSTIEEGAEGELPPLCQATLEAAFDLGADAALTNELRRTHVASCPRCQEVLELSASLKNSTQAELRQHADGLAASVMARIPASSTGLRIVAPVDSSFAKCWKWSTAVAALLLLGVGLLWFEISNQTQSKDVLSAVSIERGMLSDEKGQRVEKLVVGHSYTARERTILDVSKETILRLETDASFQIEAATRKFPVENIRLNCGDLYAVKSTNPSTVAMRVALKNFETELQSGEFYIGQVGGSPEGGTQGVLIVFSGTAQVLDRDQYVSLKAGQVYYNVESQQDLGELIANTTSTEAVLIRKPDTANDPAAKQLYRDRIAGFETELKQLRSKLATQIEKKTQRTELAELQERTQRVEEYLKQHRQRFEAMNGSEAEKKLPYEQIQRGLLGRTDPATWKL